MRFNRIDSENMRLNDNTKVSSTYTRTITTDEFSHGVLKNSRLAPFIGQMPERKINPNVDYLVPVEEHAEQLSEYAQKVQDAVNPNKNKKG